LLKAEPWPRQWCRSFAEKELPSIALPACGRNCRRAHCAGANRDGRCRALSRPGAATRARAKGPLRLMPRDEKQRAQSVQIALSGAICADRSRQLRPDLASQSGVQNVKIGNNTPVANHPRCIFAAHASNPSQIGRTDTSTIDARRDPFDIGSVVDQPGCE
jgi:hypothetical protein